MKTIEQYRENNFPIIPCKKIQEYLLEKWQKTNIEFQPGDNIGLHLTEHIDIDVDNIICHNF